MNYNINGTIYKTMPLGRAKNIAGKKFGRLTPIERVQVPGGLYAKSTYWVSKCECGGLIVTDAGSLATGNTRSCGCLHQESARSLNFIDITGKKFARLTAIKQTGETAASGSTIWLCRCECGKEITTEASRLRQGLTESCGCLASERRSITLANEVVGKKYNHFTVLKLIQHVYEGQSIYLCQCVCGEKIKVKRNQLWWKKSCGCRKRGKYSWAWNPELTDEERKNDRYTQVPGLKSWVKEIYKMCHYRCQLCGDKPRNIVAHHLNSFKGHEEQAKDLDNGTVLCRPCHNEFHKKYGNGYNTKEQFYEYARSKGVCMIGENVRRRSKTTAITD